MTELFHVIDEVAFKRIDIRLAGFSFGWQIVATVQLLSRSKTWPLNWAARGSDFPPVAEFKKRGWLELGRGSISLNDPAALRALAQH